MAEAIKQVNDQTKTKAALKSEKLQEADEKKRPNYILQYNIVGVNDLADKGKSIRRMMFTQVKKAGWLTENKRESAWWYTTYAEEEGKLKEQVKATQDFKSRT